MNEIAGRMQEHIKRTSGDMALFLLRAFSGMVLGLVLANVMQEILGKGDGENLIAFLLVLTVTTAVFLRISRIWGFTGVLVFDLVAVLTGLVLRLYIMVAPGS